MNRSILVATLGIVTASALSAQRLTVEQLRQRLAAQRAVHKSDGEMAQKTGAVELTEQLPVSTLDRWKTEMQLGPKTGEALELAADLSASLDPPSSELPPKDAPDLASRQDMIHRALEFAGTTMRSMPNFLATRLTRSFDDRPMVVSNTGWTPAHTDLHLAGTFSQQITYRNGQEVLEGTPPDATPVRSAESTPSGLITTGEFGPVLAVVLTDSQDGSMTWSHWEQAPDGFTAVFHFQVPQDVSHYAVNFCSLLAPVTASYRHINDAADAKTNCYNGTPAYHGSLSIDPETGAVLRIAIESDVPRPSPMTRAAIAVQYGKVEIAGRSYVCPVRSVAVSVVRYPETSMAPSRTIRRVNEATFVDYHRFGSTSRILTSPSTQDRH